MAEVWELRTAARMQGTLWKIWYLYWGLLVLSPTRRYSIEIVIRRLQKHPPFIWLEFMNPAASRTLCFRLRSWLFCFLPATPSPPTWFTFVTQILEVEKTKEKYPAEPTCDEEINLLVIGQLASLSFTCLNSLKLNIQFSRENIISIFLRCFTMVLFGGFQRPDTSGWL